MIEAAGDALGILFTWDRMMWLWFGTFVGMAVGFLPGIGGTSGLAIFLPFLYGMDPYSGMAFLIGNYATGHCADTFPSVLIGVPGSGGSQATIMDGYPLAKQGQAQRALTTAFVCSGVGGIFGGIILLGALYVARPLILALATPELFMLTLLGLAIVGVLSRGSALTGLIVAAFGMLLGAVGIAPAQAVERFTFGQIYLIDSIPLPVLALGLFGIPELLDLVIRKESVSKAEKVDRGRWTIGFVEAWRHRWLVLSSSTVGTVIGILPGLGGSVVDWVAYGFAKQTLKNTENFGKGDIRGLIAPEAANNAKEGGSLIPTLMFGIPGSGSGAILLVGFTLFGLQPGPAMLGRHLDMTLLIVWSVLLSTFFATVVCFVASRPISKLTNINGTVLVPFLWVLLFIACFQTTRHWGDIFVLILLGLLGWTMKQLGWPRPPILIGFILATPAERYLHISISRYGMEFLLRPGVIIIGALVLALVVMGPIIDGKRAKKRRLAEAAGTTVVLPAVGDEE